MIRSHFVGGVSEQGDMQKGSFQRWCKEVSLLFSLTGVAFQWCPVSQDGS